ncbi:30S ribosomal protein S5 [Metamycoplasma cloacale]|uniref:Small ribosomal subunit protein uS5 n=1 Tax=Metamycoplasma cloacale TaxID=92401 RepID=A0A2Z4LLZ1_9BACT|nr:30S ribosomal protein S5 [Metamycoplasma cloacale]VEU79474.1 30S ribosomal protein S5 [Metamycoplasma cloacale]
MAEELKKKEAVKEVKSSATKVVAAVKSTEDKEKKQPAVKPVRKAKQFTPKTTAPVQQFEEKVVDIARVTTVVKGGRRFSFSAYVVVGDKKGKVGFGHGKANEVQDAIKKAIKDAQKNIIVVPIVNGTIPHEIQEKFLASKVQLRPAPKGAGIIASGTVRAVVELAGYTDISTKTYGSRTKQNIVQATVNALKKVKTADEIAKLRDIDVKHLLSK